MPVQAVLPVRELLTNVTQDVRFAARMLWRNRGFAASAMLILALGIAASTGFFAVLDTVVLHLCLLKARIGKHVRDRSFRERRPQWILSAPGRLGVGLVLSVGLSSVLARWSIRNVDDPVVLVAAEGTLLLATGIATLIPARRATAIEPTIALRVE